MKNQFYNLLVPKSIRESIYRADICRFKGEEIKRIQLIEEALPRAELSAVYIANLRVLADRNALLNVMKKESCVAEIGARDGNFSEKILSITKPKKLHLLDTWYNENSDEGLAERRIKFINNKFKGELAAGQVAVHYGEPPAELQGFKEDYLDWIYIDKVFSYNDIARLLELCRTKVKSEGIIAGQNYVAGYLLTRERYGVVEAVNTFCKNNGWELIYLTNETHRNISYAIRKMAL